MIKYKKLINQLKIKVNVIKIKLNNQIYESREQAIESKKKNYNFKKKMKKQQVISQISIQKLQNARLNIQINMKCKKQKKT